MKIKRAIFVLGVALCMVFFGGCGLENQSVSSDGFVEEAEDEKAGKISENREKSELILTDSGKEFLGKMCLYLPEFSNIEETDEDFWKDFIFYSYTGTLDDGVEVVEVWRDDLGFREPERKISRQEVEEYVKLALGVSLPAYEPSFEDMEEGQTACYYKDGFYYIGGSDFPDISYEFESCTVREDGTAVVEYRAVLEGDTVLKNVVFHISEAENENGFIITERL